MHSMARSGDIGLAAVLFAITLPLMAIVALTIKLESPGPVLVGQTCIGRRGRRFHMLKFRTAEFHPRLMPLPSARQPTVVGRFLSYSRIEILPQIVNVLRGDLSIFDRDGRSPWFFD